METQDEDDNIEIVNTPTNFRPDLAEYGIEEVDKGVCEDTSENRRILRKNRLTWRTIWTANGEASGNIEAISDEMQARRNQQAMSDKADLLVDRRDPNSDYLSGLPLILADADSLTPPWVIAATQHFRDLEKKRIQNPDRKFQANIISPPKRCRYIKSDTYRCQMWTSGRADSDGLCRLHLGSVHNNTGAAVERARKRVMQAAPRAVDVLEEMMESATSEPVRLKAATEMLDRAGIRGGIEVDQNVQIEVKPARQVVLERIEKLKNSETKKLELEAKRYQDEKEDIEDAVVIEDGDTEK